MSFMQPQAPAPFVPPRAPTPPAQMTQPTTVKPPKKASQPTFIGEALSGQTTGGRSLLGGTPAALGA